jgi:4-hydroxybenzoate polyprenyltransferase
MQQKLKSILRKLLILSCKVGTTIVTYADKIWDIILSVTAKILITCKNHWPTVRERLGQYALLIRLDRPVGIFLLLWPTLWGLWIAAKGFPDPSVFMVFVFGVILMRSAGCVLNDIADQRFDPHVSRTKTRPLASGKVSSIEALTLAFSLIVIAFLLVLTMNWLTVQLAFIAVILAGIYPFMKRYTYLPQFFLGLAFGWAIPMAFAAQTGSVPQLAWLLLIANVLWSVVYDTMYAMVDKEDDLRIGVKSTAILFDDADRVIIGIIQVLVLTTLIMAGRQAQLGVSYFIGIAIASCFFIYQLRLIWHRKPEQCMKAFLNNNWFGLTIFIGLFFDFIINNNV